MTKEITELEKEYLKELDCYIKVIYVNKLISLNQHGINTDGRGVRAVKIFTRQTILGLSLGKLLPRTNFANFDDGELWDVISIASLARNLLEGYLSLYFWGLEELTESEADLRFIILQLHRNIELYDIRKLYDKNDPELMESETLIKMQKEKRNNHPFLNSLTIEQKNKVKKDIDIYMTKTDFENELTICKNLKREYKQLSTFVHPSPFSTESIDNQRGRGLACEIDVVYCIICLTIARRYLVASIVGIADKFPEKLAKRFSKEIDSIRPYIEEVIS